MEDSRRRRQQPVIFSIMHRATLQLAMYGAPDVRHSRTLFRSVAAEA